MPVSTDHQAVDPALFYGAEDGPGHGPVVPVEPGVAALEGGQFVRRLVLPHCQFDIIETFPAAAMTRLKT
ncbi:MAG TPA: hypothetical protein VJ417_14025, partial [Candidatus Glassbacteria bacterium]|nr:hypothetical protein [Candidatus Glassbacteria bacterium]